MPSVELNEHTYGQWITDGAQAVANQWDMYVSNKGTVTKEQYQRLGEAIERLKAAHQLMGERQVNA